jgi:hypothetical protein
MKFKLGQVIREKVTGTDFQVVGLVANEYKLKQIYSKRPSFFRNWSFVHEAFRSVSQTNAPMGQTKEFPMTAQQTAEQIMEAVIAGKLSVDQAAKLIQNLNKQEATAAAEQAEADREPSIARGPAPKAKAVRAVKSVKTVAKKGSKKVGRVLSKTDLAKLAKARDAYFKKMGFGKYAKKGPKKTA